MNRLLSIDALRGLTVIFMIIVNNPGTWASIYPPLRHAEWNGCTPTDLVFPFFMFIVGLSAFFSMQKMQCSKNKLLLKMSHRAILIVLVGILLNWFPFYHRNIEDLRIMGVLQRIGFSYFIASVILIYLPKVKFIIVTIGIILIGYWLLMQGYVGWGEAITKENNLVRTIDLLIMGNKHLYGGFGLPFDPEGLLSSLPATCNILIGFLVAKYFHRHRQNVKVTLWKLLFGGMVLISVGMLWSYIFPLNKPIWSSSFVLYTCGLATLLWGICIYLIDVKYTRYWYQPFIHVGRNPLFIFVLSGAIAKIMGMTKITTAIEGKVASLHAVIYDALFGIIPVPEFRSLCFALFYVAIYWFIAYKMYQRKIIIKL